MKPRSPHGSGMNIPYDWNGSYKFPGDEVATVYSDERGVVGRVPVGGRSPVVPQTIGEWLQLEHDWRSGLIWIYHN